jgi:ABC-2 type transport system ATP-binding protein
MLVVTHDVHLAASLCDWVAILDGGKIVRQGTPVDLMHLLAALRIYIRFHQNPKAVVEKLGKLQHLTGLHHFENEVHVYTTDPEEDINEVIEIVVESGLRIAHIDLPEPSLEEVFMKVIAERRHLSKGRGVGRETIRLPEQAPPEPKPVAGA